MGEGGGGAAAEGPYAGGEGAEARAPEGTGAPPSGSRDAKVSFQTWCPNHLLDDLSARFKKLGFLFLLSLGGLQKFVVPLPLHPLQLLLELWAAGGSGHLGAGLPGVVGEGRGRRVPVVQDSGHLAPPLDTGPHLNMMN